MQTLSILVKPYNNTLEELSDSLARLCWYFFEETHLRFYVVTTEDIPDALPVQEALNQKLPIKFEKMRKQFFKYVKQDGMKFDLCINFSKRNKTDEATRNFCVDRFSINQDSQVFNKILNIIRADYQQETVSESIERFRKLKIEFESVREVVNLFATGPNLQEIFTKDRSVKDGINIICNSTILHEELLGKINPHILVFADPIFHFGPSVYTESFIERYKSFKLRYPDCYTVVPHHYSEIFKKHYPYDQRVIFIPSYLLDEPSLDLTKFFGVKITKNILTYLMFPLATSLGSHISFYGFDGKKEKSNYFWGHNKKAQFNSEMDKIKIAHPAFFKISYDRYYKEHCQLLAKFINKATEGGCTFEVCTTSYIKCLAVYSFQKVLGEKVLFENTGDVYVSILPNMDSEKGHHLSHERELSKHLPAGSNHILLCHKNFSIGVEKMQACRTYNKTVWTQRHNLDYYQFFIETFDALEKIRKAVLNREVRIYISFYMCTDSYVNYFLKLSRIFKGDKFYFHINLFYICDKILDSDSNVIARIKKDYIEKLQDYEPSFPNIKFYVDNRELRKLVYSLYHLNLGDWPHFSSTDFSFHEKLIRVKNNENVFYCPSLLQKERGLESFFLNVKKEKKFLKEANISIKARIFDLSPGRSYFLSLQRKDLLPDNISYIDGQLSEEAFSKLFHESDFIVIPYPKDKFKYRTSAILVDAIRMKRPVLVCTGTWMAKIVCEFKIGEHYDENDHNCFRLAVENLLRNRDQYIQNMNRMNVANVFSSERLLSTITSNVKPIQSVGHNKMNLYSPDYFIKVVENGMIDAFSALAKEFFKKAKRKIVRDYYKYKRNLSSM